MMGELGCIVGPPQFERILVIGKGIVGDATGHALEQAGKTVVYHDPPKGIDGSEVLEAPHGVDVAIVCVGTPGTLSGLPDMSQVRDALVTLQCGVWRGPVGIRSTVLPGTCEQWQKAMPDFSFFAWPEFLRAAEAREWALKPRYVVMGLPHDRDIIGLRSLPWQPPGKTFICTPTEAEFIKLATNALLAATVGVANELAELGAKFGIAWNRVIPDLCARDENLPRNVRVVGPNGGFGGACLPKDLAAIVALAGTDAAPVLAAVQAANNRRTDLGRSNYEDCSLEHLGTTQIGDVPHHAGHGDRAEAPGH